ncbi:piwi domain-containing protein [Aphelenchoides avenae]|nr:piwi domain-containing protein [Aphelenchus avenae]
MEAMSDEEHIDFPPKKTNEGDVRNANALGVIMNAYGVRLDGSVNEVHKYELKFITKRGERERDLTRGPKNDVSNEQRRQLLWELFQIMLSLDDSFFGSERDRKAQYCFDCGINMYSVRKLMDRGQERTFYITTVSNAVMQACHALVMFKDKIRDECRNYIGRNVENIEARLLATDTIDLFDKSAIEDVSQGNRSVIQFLEILSSQQMINEGRHHMFPQKMYEKNSKQTLQRDPRILKDGMQKNVRFVGDSVESAQPIIQIDREFTQAKQYERRMILAKKAAFFPAIALGAYLEQILPGGGPLEEKLSMGRNFQAAVKQVKNLVVRTTHLDLNRIFAISGLTKDSANRVTFEIEGNEITVENYFKEKYHMRLRHYKLPCAIDRRVARIDGQSKKVENFYPIEVLDIVDGQRVPLQKQSGSLTEQMIRQCQALPKAFKELNEQQRSKAFISSGNPYFKAHGVRPESDMLRAQADILFPPALVYDNGRDREEPQGANLMWKLGPQRKFLIPAPVPPVWCAVIFQRGVQGGRCQDFIKRLVQSANNRGFPINLPNRYDEWDDTSMEFLNEKFAFYATNRVRFILFFTKDKMDPVHHTMKYLETQHGIITQHIFGGTMEKGIGNKGAFLVLDNILLKMHLKLGGVNHGLSTARDMQRSNSRFSNYDVVAKQWLAPTRMFIGLDLSHAGPQSLYERQAGQSVGDPTVVGMAYTCGETVKISGTYWLQEPRLTIIQDLKRHIKEAIEHFASETGKPPISLVIYRSGVSEGEYRKVSLNRGYGLHYPLLF